MIEHATLARVLPFGIYISFMLIASILGLFGVDEQQSRWLYPVKTALIVGVLWSMRRQYTELRLPRGKSWLMWAGAVVAGVFVFVAWINLSADWMVHGKSVGFDPRGAGGALDWFLVSVRLFGAALVVPVMEELFWRSYLMRWINNQDFLSVEPARVGSMAFASTALLFAVEHHLWFAGLVAGVVYNLLYMRSANLWSPILAHAVTNGVLGVWVLYTGSWSYW